MNQKCTHCGGKGLKESSKLDIAEQVEHELQGVDCFVLCTSCGNVMLKNQDTGAIVSTHFVKNPEIVNLSLIKLFGGSERKPTHYGFTHTNNPSEAIAIEPQKKAAEVPTKEGSSGASSKVALDEKQRVIFSDKLSNSSKSKLLKGTILASFFATILALFKRKR